MQNNVKKCFFTDDNGRQQDYKPIDVTAGAFVRPGAGANMASLYNGNIAGMSVNIAALQKGGAGTNAEPLFYQYRYDQLNRLKTMQAFNGLSSNSWTAVAIDDHKESVVYDPNGNILSYHRKGAPRAGKATEMDQLKYYYDGQTNRLNHVYDSVPNSAYTEDIESQDADNYLYDKIGNLKRDVKEGITNITWTVYGKIKTIVKSGNTITYEYDAAGNRISKTVSATNLTTVYVRDASGNVLSVYEKPASGSLVQKELHIYGSSRLGLVPTMSIAPVDVSLSGSLTGTWRTFVRGEKLFELSNHLGNVLATVSDRKVQVNASGSVGYYMADVKSATDYYPFGMGMVGRSWQAGGYRYGFNGKENDNEVKGDGNQQDYGMRIYDTRLGKFLSVDPLTQSYPELTPYQFASNIPIKAIDIDGLESSWRPPGQLAPRENDYKFGSQSTCQGCTVDKEMYTPSTPVYKPAFVRSGAPPTATEQAAIDKEVAARDANGGFNDAYMLSKIKKENIAIVEASPTNFFPFIGNLKKAGKYELLGMHEEAGDAVKDFGKEVVLTYVGGKIIGAGFKYLNRVSNTTVNETRAVASFGTSTSTDYRETFFAAHPHLRGQVVVHHAVEQQVLTRYSGVVTSSEIHSLENLRGIPNSLNNSLHLSEIRRAWNQFYRSTPNPTREQLLRKATEIDFTYGNQFLPNR